MTEVGGFQRLVFYLTFMGTPRSEEYDTWSEANLARLSFSKNLRSYFQIEVKWVPL